ncbi:MAG: hypothetical protein HYV26_23035 [Candidatus Hydrogenedentes bacterium]|nr:hypothetical protein [Candidatus Hydrogenedentota bacterium]
MVSVLGVVLSAFLLAGCPGFTPEGFLFFLHNDSEDTPIISVEFRGPGDDDFGANMLDEDLQPGDEIDFLLEAPFRFEDEQGVTYRVRVTYEGLLGLEVQNVGVFSCLHAGERTDWNWTPGDEPDRCVD